MLTTQEFNEYVVALGQHDWAFEFADDHAVWAAGRANARILKSQANRDSLLLRAYLVFKNKTANPDAALKEIYQLVAEEQTV